MLVNISGVETIYASIIALCLFLSLHLPDVLYIFLNSTMDRNHGNIYNKLLALVLGRYRVFHNNMNDTEYGVGEENEEGNGYRNGKGYPAWAE